MIICQLCFREFTKQISNSHLKHSHAITTLQYKLQFGEKSLSSDEYRAQRSHMSSGSNNQMFGKTHSVKSKQLISDKNTGNIPHNKGKQVTDPEHLLRIKAGIDKREKRYRDIGYHPRLGAVLSVDTKLQISSSVKKYASDNKDLLLARAQKIRSTKIKNGNLHKSYFSGKHTAETLDKISKSIKISFAKKRTARLTEWKSLLSTINIEITNISGKLATLHCDICKNDFTFTVQYFSKSKFRSDLCPCCRAPVTHSKAELEILEFVRTLTPNKVFCGSRNVIAPLELDIYCPTEQIAIEYCGLYWHGENQGKTSEYHLNKLQLCLEKDIQLLTIFEDEWIHHKEIVISRLTSKFRNGNASIIKIGARKCTIAEITSRQVNDFLNDNHLQGSGSSNIRLGLFYNTDLLSVMTFNKPNISRGLSYVADNTFELNRFCSKINYQVQGGADKLFNYFITNYTPDQIITYSDKRWGSGTVYSNMGFSQISDTPPNYWYIQGIQRKHRYGFRKNANDDHTLTEWENRKAQGLDRIWDCGNTKWIWSKK